MKEWDGLLVDELLVFLLLCCDVLYGREQFPDYNEYCSRRVSNRYRVESQRRREINPQTPWYKLLGLNWRQLPRGASHFLQMSFL